MSVQSASHIFGFCTQGKYLGKKKNKTPESYKKQNLNLLCADNFLHSIYIVFTTIYITFTLY